LQSVAIWNFLLLTNIEPSALSDFQMLSFYVTQATDSTSGNYPNNTYPRLEIVLCILSSGDECY